MEDRNPLPAIMMVITLLATAFATGVYFRKPEPAVAKPAPQPEAPPEPYVHPSGCKIGEIVSVRGDLLGYVNFAMTPAVGALWEAYSEDHDQKGVNILFATKQVWSEKPGGFAKIVGLLSRDDLEANVTQLNNHTLWVEIRRGYDAEGHHIRKGSTGWISPHEVGW